MYFATMSRTAAAASKQANAIVLHLKKWTSPREGRVDVSVFLLRYMYVYKENGKAMLIYYTAANKE